jgi:hypothetical protein
MNHRLLHFSFLCGLLVTASTMFGMENPQTISIFYEKDNNNNYYQLDQQGKCKRQDNIDLHQLLSPHHSNVGLYYDHATQTYSLIKDKQTLGSGTLNTSLMKVLIVLNDYSLYAKLNNNEYAQISSIISPNMPRPDSNPFDTIVKEYKKRGEIDIIEGEDLDKKVSFLPSYRTIARSLTILALVYAIIKYIHHLPQLFNKIIHMHYCQLRSNRAIV